MTEAEITNRIWDVLAQGSLPMDALWRVAGIAKLTAKSYVDQMTRRGLVEEIRSGHGKVVRLVCLNRWHIAESLGWMRCPECPELANGMVEPAALDVVKEILRVLDVPIKISISAPVTGDRGSRESSVAIRLGTHQEYRITVEEL